MNIRVAESDHEIAECYEVMHQLREKLTMETFAQKVRAQQDSGYHLVYAHDGDTVVAVAGFRFLETLVDGRYLYVDDLVTSATERSKGHGRALLSWLTERAQEKHCGSLQLDSGLARKDAHRFYEREGMQNRGLRFQKDV